MQCTIYQQQTDVVGVHNSSKTTCPLAGNPETQQKFFGGPRWCLLRLLLQVNRTKTSGARLD